MRIPKVNFSYSFSKGSMAERLKKAEAINSEIFDNVLNLYQETDSVPLRKIEKVYKQALPEQIDFKIKKLLPEEKNNAGGLLSTFFNKTSVNCYRMSLPAEENKLNVENIPILMHESTHLLDHALNPKINRNLEKSYIYKGLADDMEDFYCTNLYNPTFFSISSVGKILNCKKLLRKFLSDFSAGDQIIILNKFKQSLSMEVHAYKEEDKYISLICKKKDLKKIYDPIELMERAMFNLKIKLIDNFLKNIIESQRNI